MADADLKDFDKVDPEQNVTVLGVSIEQDLTQVAQVDDALRRVLTVAAKGDFGVGPVKMDLIEESTADAGVSIPDLVPPFANQISGFVMAQGADTNHDIDLTAGAAADATGARIISRPNPISKQIDAAWIEGTNSGGFPTGLTLAADTTYHFFVIMKTDGTVDAGFDTSVTATNLLADATAFTYYRRVGSVITDATSNITDFSAIEEGGGAVRFYWNLRTVDSDVTNPGTAIRADTLTVPTGIKVLAMVSATVFSSNANVNYILSSAESGDLAPTGANADITIVTADENNGSTAKQLTTNLGGQIQSRFSASNANVVYRVKTEGWVDSRV